MTVPAAGAAIATKGCPVVIRGRAVVEILAFEHPLAGLQLVKGSIEAHETAAQAAVRELYEESGLLVTGPVSDLGLWNSGHQGQVWSFHLCGLGALPDTWVHHAADDGGHDFRFFWHVLDEAPGDQWHPVFRDALKFIAGRLPPV